MKLMAMVFFLTFSPLTWSHGDGHGHDNNYDKPKTDHHHHHGHMISKKDCPALGMKQIHRLIKAGKIDGSWKNAKHHDSVMKKNGHHNEWLVTFENEAGKKGKKLFIFFNESGKFVAANFTGK